MDSLDFAQTNTQNRSKIIFRVLKELKKNFTWEDIALEIAANIEYNGAVEEMDLSSDLLKKYYSGARIPRSSQLMTIVRALSKSKLKTKLILSCLDECNEMLELQNIRKMTGSPKGNKAFTRLLKQSVRSKNKDLERIEDGILNLLEWGYEDNEILYMVDAILEKHNPNRSSFKRFSIISPDSVLNYRVDHKPYKAVAISINYQAFIYTEP